VCVSVKNAAGTCSNDLAAIQFTEEAGAVADAAGRADAGDATTTPPSDGGSGSDGPASVVDAAGTGPEASSPDAASTSGDASTGTADASAPDDAATD
jgi:hypothetical protein